MKAANSGHEAGPVVGAASLPGFIYGTAWKEERTADLTELALRMGFRALDTANQRRHYFEEGVGRGIAAAYRSGIVTRAQLFLQTKFTYRRGQDRRLPYDPKAALGTQVAQSMASSLEHLATDHVDSYVLHGPVSGDGWTDDDAQVWAAMIDERTAGRTRWIGISNVTLRNLKGMIAAGAQAPKFVQNRCYAHSGWDREVREFCSEHKIVYQGFSLLTANAHVMEHEGVARIASRLNATPAQVIFSYARAIGILPLTGTSSAEHMNQDLASLDLSLTRDEVEAVGSLQPAKKGT